MTDLASVLFHKFRERISKLESDGSRARVRRGQRKPSPVGVSGLPPGGGVRGLTESQWKCVEPLLPEMRWREGGPGRPPRDRRTVLNGILWVLRTGAPWEDLPDRYPSHQTCHRRFQHWCRNGTLDRILEALAKDLQKWGRIDLTEGFIDGSFAGAKKGGGALASERPNGARTKLMVIADRHGLGRR